ncbi:MAG TPA: hypothetical protein PL143_09715 [Rhodocyclaceae bacterium]|nr:hypothetical protein [Rhodocyclaceae bacterium]
MTTATTVTSPTTTTTPTTATSPTGPHGVSHVLFYLSDGATLIGVKLDYGSGVETKNYQQPESLSGQVENIVNGAPNLGGYSVVGYTIKAGPGFYDYGTTYSQISSVGRSDARADGNYDGLRVNVGSRELEGITPIALTGTTALGVGDLLDDGGDLFGDADGGEGGGSSLGEGELFQIVTLNSPPGFDGSDDV